MIAKRQLFYQSLSKDHQPYKVRLDNGELTEYLSQKSVTWVPPVVSNVRKACRLGTPTESPVFAILDRDNDAVYASRADDSIESFVVAYRAGELTPVCDSPVLRIGLNGKHNGVTIELPPAISDPAGGSVVLGRENVELGFYDSSSQRCFLYVCTWTLSIFAYFLIMRA